MNPGNTFWTFTGLAVLVIALAVSWRIVEGGGFYIDFKEKTMKLSAVLEEEKDRITELDQQLVEVQNEKRVALDAIENLSAELESLRSQPNNQTAEVVNIENMARSIEQLSSQLMKVDVAPVRANVDASIKRLDALNRDVRGEIL
ncbi:MAG TPA: hypothetical protein PKE12_06615 [Kiritimatiellia bacterium]|nr:hypothetical protein [Kiritimatiellia bacterium]